MGLSELLKATADPTRLRILSLLQEGSICVCDLQVVLDIPQSTVSRHLAVLRHAGLVVDARLGTRVLYSLARAANPQIKALQRLLAEVFSYEDTLQADRARLKQTGAHRKRRLQSALRGSARERVGASP